MLFKPFFRKPLKFKPLRGITERYHNGHTNVQKTTENNMKNTKINDTINF